MECVRRIRELCDKLQIVEGQDSLSREAQRNATLLFHTLLRSTLASKRVCGEYKLTRAAWHWLTGEVETRWVRCCAALRWGRGILVWLQGGGWWGRQRTSAEGSQPGGKAPGWLTSAPQSLPAWLTLLPITPPVCRFMNAMAAPGEVVGTVAAQSIGEPTTQVGSGAAWVPGHWPAVDSAGHTGLPASSTAETQALRVTPHPFPPPTHPRTLPPHHPPTHPPALPRR